MRVTRAVSSACDRGRDGRIAPIMTPAGPNLVPGAAATWRDFYELGKPKVVALIVFTAVVGMFLAVPGVPPWQALLYGTVGIGLAASSAAAINHVVYSPHVKARVVTADGESTELTPSEIKEWVTVAGGDSSFDSMPS